MRKAETSGFLNEELADRWRKGNSAFNGTWALRIPRVKAFPEQFAP
jgi:hypothetical protein